MPQLSKIKKMPESDQQWLNEWLKDNHFADLDSLVEQLEARGYEISRSSVGRYSQEFKKHCENLKRSTEMAVFLADQMGDDRNALGDAAVNTMQAQMLDAMTKYDWERIKDMDPGELALSISRLSRAGVNQKKHMVDIKERMAQVKEELEALTKDTTAGLSQEALERIENAARLL